MALQDTFGTSMMISEARNLRPFAGIFDALGDVVNRYGAAIAALTAVHWGLWSWQMDIIMLLMMITSYNITNRATSFANAILPTEKIQLTFIEFLVWVFKKVTRKV